jgi:hypothetical protein
MIRINNLPFILIIISFSFPQFLSPIISWQRTFHAPLILSAMFLIIYLIKNKKTILYKGNKQFYRILFLQFILLLFQVLTGRGFVLMGAGLNLFLLVFIFLQFFYIGKLETKTIFLGISLLYSFLLLFLFVEFIITILGGQTLLDQLLPIYKTYNPSELFQRFGIGGLNSILGGSQIAGMISLFSFFWFFILYYEYSHFKVIRKELLFLLILLSVFLYLITMTGTTTLLAVMAFVLFVKYYLKSNTAKTLYLALFAILMSVSTLLFYNGLLFERFFTEKEFTLVPAAKAMLSDLVSSGNTIFNSMTLDVYSYYAFHLTNTFYLWLWQDWDNFLFGLGVKHIELDIFTGSDNGFLFSVLLKCGLFGTILLLVGIWVACYKPLKIIVKTKNGLINNWSRLSVIFSIYSVLFLSSTIHYYQALENPGVYPLFAISISLSIYCNQKWRQTSISSDGLVKKNIL